jgi:hypothetical protein
MMGEVQISSDYLPLTFGGKGRIPRKDKMNLTPYFRKRVLTLVMSTNKASFNYLSLPYAVKRKITKSQDNKIRSFMSILPDQVNSSYNRQSM